MQILTNLLTNAVKFSADDSVVSVAARRVGDMLEISVTDHGLGMDQDDTVRVFEKFSQLLQPGGRSARGSGLGLFITKAMVEAQGGSIRVESSKGEGSKFSYTIPVAPGP
jgi:signal transduction histidine kinase